MRRIVLGRFAPVGAKMLTLPTLVLEGDELPLEVEAWKQNMTSLVKSSGRRSVVVGHLPFVPLLAMLRSDGTRFFFCHTVFGGPLPRLLQVISDRGDEGPRPQHEEHTHKQLQNRPGTSDDADREMVDEHSN